MIIPIKQIGNENDQLEEAANEKYAPKTLKVEKVVKLKRFKLISEVGRIILTEKSVFKKNCQKFINF